MSFFRRKKQQVQINAQEVVMTQTFLEAIDGIFETMTGFLDLLSNPQSNQYDDEFLLRMNEVLLQGLNTFGVTCNNYKNDNKMMMTGKEHFERKWNKLNAKHQETAVQYGTFIRLALNGKKMKLYPLIEITQQQQQNNYNEKTVNESFGQLIGGNCRVHKKAEEVRNDFQSYDKQHEELYQSQKNRPYNKCINVMQQPNANDMIMVSGKRNVKFDENNHYDHQRGPFDKEFENHSKHKPQNKSNTFLVQNVKVKNVNLPQNLPVKIVEYKHNSKKEVKLVQLPTGSTLNNVPMSWLCNPSKIDEIQNAERNYIEKNGALGYDSLLDKDEEERLIQQYVNLSRDLCSWGK